MLWLSRPPFVRWLAVVLVILTAAWSEFAPQPRSEIFVLSRDVPAGTPLTDEVVDVRLMTDPGFSTLGPGGVAAFDLKAGEPLVQSMVTDTVIPSGWVAIDAPLPSGAQPGSHATAVILAEEPTGAAESFPALVLSAQSEDAFATGSGTVAVPPEWFAAAGAAVADGRLIIGVEMAGG